MPEFQMPKHIKTAVAELTKQFGKQGYTWGFEFAAVAAYASELLGRRAISGSQNPSPVIRVIGEGLRSKDESHSVDFVAFQNGPQPPEYMLLSRDTRNSTVSAISLVEAYAGFKAGKSGSEIFESNARTTVDPNAVRQALRGIQVPVAA